MKPTRSYGFHKTVQSVETVIREHHLFKPGSKILVAVSGGPDSMALLSMLSELQSSWDLHLGVLFCHHGLRAAADEEERLVRHWARQWNCPFVSRRLEVRAYQRQKKGTLQEAARDLRYQAFAEELDQQRGDWVALGHTANDMAEEVLIGLIRGAGLGGLAGIPIQRDRFIRPLLKTYRPALYQYLKEKNIPFCEDLSNCNLRFLRARIRHHLIPELLKYSPSIIQQLNKMAWLLQADEAYLQKRVSKVLRETVSFQGTSALLQRKILSRLPQAIASRLVQKALFQIKGTLRDIGSVHLYAIMEAAKGGSKNGRLKLPQGWETSWDETHLAIHPGLPPDSKKKPFSYLLNRPGQIRLTEINATLVAKRTKILSALTGNPKNPNQAWLDYQALSWPLLIRNGLPGDRFQPLGMTGTKKVSRFLMDRKVPSSRRAEVPLVLAGGNIIWVAGFEIAQPFSLTPQSREALHLEYLPETCC